MSKKLYILYIYASTYVQIHTVGTVQYMQDSFHILYNTVFRYKKEYKKRVHLAQKGEGRRQTYLPPLPKYK